MTENRASCATDCLERVWDLLRELHPEIPPAIMLIYAQHTRKPRQNGGVMLGHFSGTVWRAPGPKKRHEVGLSPYLFHKPNEVLQTLLHEAAHAALYESDPRCKLHRAGCSPNDPYYHRTIFRDLCQKWGLECKFLNRRYGYCVTKWPCDRVPELYRAARAELKENLPLGVKEDPPQRTAPQVFRLRCQCAEGRSVYARLPVARFGGISCKFCGKEFKPVKDLAPLSTTTARQE
jgi:hypothetical protein